MPLPPSRRPQWASHRRLLERELADLHRCSSPTHVKQLHAQLFKAHLHSDLFVAPKLVSAYSLSHLISLAARSFYHVPRPNTHLYNTLIRAYAHNSLPSHAFRAFQEMLKDAIFPDNFTYPFLLKACSGPPALRYIEAIHTHVLKWGFLADIFVPNALIDSYSRAGGGIGHARKVFDEMPEKDVVSWNSMVAGLVRAGELAEARQVFEDMPERDVVSWNSMMDGLAKAGEMDAAFKLFQRMPERNVVSWSTLISGYSKAGDMEMARVLFDQMPVKSLVPWTIMVAGYAEKGLTKEAFSLFDQMEEDGLELDDGAIVSILAGCAESGLLGLGKRVHTYVERSKLRFTPQVRNALVDMYAKCGNLREAWSVFDRMVDRDIVTWNSMVQGLAMHGHGEQALDLFSRMKREGFTPDGVTFIGVLCACTHVGLIEDARRYFSSMERDYGIIPQIEHYGCMIDVLGRGGLLREALDLINSMPLEPNAIIWGTLLGACRMHNNVGLAEEVVEQLIKLEPTDAGNYAILSNIYAAAGRWDGVANARVQMKGTGAQKLAGSSWIELDDTVHEFTVGDRLHPQADRVFRMLRRLGQHLKQVGYAPQAYV